MRRRAGATHGKAAGKSPAKKIFLSHAALDRPLAEYVRDSILTSNPAFEVFVSSKPGQIPAEAEWWDVIRTRLLSADAYCVLLTPNSVTRPWVFFEFGAAWMSGRTVVTARAASLEPHQVPPPLSIKQAPSIEIRDDALEIFRALGLILDNPAAFAARARALGANAILDALREAGWVGLEWDGTYYAWQGPLAGLADLQSESEPPGLIKALGSEGLQPSWSQTNRVAKHKQEGKRVIYATDRKTWRRTITNGDAVLMVRATQESAVASAQRLQDDRTKAAQRDTFERSNKSVAIALQQIRLLYDAAERLVKVASEKAPDLQLSTRRTRLDLLIRAGYGSIRLAWVQQYSDGILDAHLVLEEWLGIPDLQEDSAHPTRPGLRQLQDFFALRAADNEQRWLWQRTNDEYAMFTNEQLADWALSMVLARLKNPFPRDLTDRWRRR